MNDSFAPTPQPPYWVVIFTSRRAADDGADYARMSERLAAIAPAQPGFLGIESARGADGVGITVSYWTDEASIAAWKAVAVHLAAQRGGREHWYADYAVRIARVERAYTLADSPRQGL